MCGEVAPLTVAIRPKASAASDWRTKMRADTASAASLARSLTVKGAHQDTEIEPCDMDQVALVEVLPSAQPCSTHAAGDRGHGRRSARPFLRAARIVSRPISDFSAHTIGVQTVAVARRLVAMPTQVALGRLGFGDARASTRRLPEPSIVRANDSPCRRPRRRVPPRSAPAQPRRGCARRRPSVGESVVVSPSSARCDRRGHDDAGVEVDRRAPACRPDASFRPSSWRSWRHGRSGSSRSAFDSVLPLRFRSKRARYLGARRVDGRSLSPSASASRDSSRRWSRRTIVRNAALASIVEPSTADPLALHQAALGHELSAPSRTTVSCASCGRRERVRDSHE